MPRFGPHGGDASNGRRPAEQEWLLIDLDVDYVRGTLLPAMLNRYLGDSGRLDYDAEVVVNGNPSQQIYRFRSDHDHRSRLPADASVALLDTGPMTVFPNNRPLYGGPAHSGPPRPGPPPCDSDLHRRPPEKFRLKGRGPNPGGGGAGPFQPDYHHGAWLLLVHRVVTV